jgi:hypothetical protein
MQALMPLVGTWQVSVKVYQSGSGSAQQTPSSEMTGTSTRSWMFQGKVLEEEVRLNQSRTAQAETGQGNLGYAEAAQTTPPTPPGRPTPPPRPDSPSTPPPSTPPTQPPGRTMDSAQPFQGHGMFGFNSENNQYQHVWADNSGSKICFSTGMYDQSARTITFNLVEGSSSAMPSRTAPRPTPPTTPRPGGTSDEDEEDSEGGPRAQVDRPGQTPPGQRPSTQTPPSGQSVATPKVDLTGLEKIVVRILGDDRHVIEYYKGGAAGGAQGTKIMEITYSKGGRGTS